MRVSTPIARPLGIVAPTNGTLRSYAKRAVTFAIADGTLEKVRATPSQVRAIKRELSAKGAVKGVVISNHKTERIVAYVALGHVWAQVTRQDGKPRWYDTTRLPLF
jgi:hypothetical protein